MTTKYKIASGFLLMLILIGCVATLGYRAVQQSADEFYEYSRLSRLNVIASDAITSLVSAASETYRFTNSRDVTLMNNARKHLETFNQQIKSSKNFVLRADRIAVLDKIETNVPIYSKVLDNVQRETEESYRQYQDVLQPNVRTLGLALQEISAWAKKDGNADDMAYYVSKVWEDLAAARSSLSRYAESRVQQDADRSRENMGKMTESLKAVQTAVRSDVDKENFKKAMDAFNAANSALTAMEASVKNLNKTLEGAAAVRNDITETIGKLNDDVNSQMLDYGVQSLKATEESQHFMLIFSGIGLLLSVGCTLFIIAGLIRVLNALSAFAGAIAKGNFTFALSVREKGEIGATVAALRQIPETLNTMVDEYRKLETGVQNGELNIQGDANKFAGEFAVLVKGTNAVLTRFVQIINNIPAPMVMLNKDLKASFLNTVAQNLAGTDYRGKTCGELFQREDYASAACGLMCAVKTNSISSGDTVAHPRGKRLDIHYTAIPMHDEQGKLSSVLQFITDLTQIKDTERTIMNVTKQAQEVVTRVATASEELSIQVEQVSRGTEVQRTRVESTASAMAEMNSTVLEVARNAGQASQQSDLSRRKAEEGAVLVNSVVKSINTVNAVATTLHSNMHELGKMAEGIGGVMNVISDIADQTNLLALNAAIEAARAGDAGRGFAVVADEVRKLAEKTMSATQEVGTSIKAIQTSARTNINEVSNAVKDINEATTLANSSGNALAEIVHLAASSSAVVASIATAAEQQSATSEEINRAVAEISQVVNETSEGMNQSTEAIRELSSMAQELRRIMSTLR